MMKDPDARTQCEWERLERHFHYHGLLLARFRTAGPSLVLGMVRSGRNEHGLALSAFERAALVERHCEIFGTWPPG
jgi:hypothetical protein